MLTIMYLVVLGLCFIIPIFYYLRMHCEDQNLRRQREIEFAEVLEASREQTDETRAARRKYRDEKRARLLQLFAPVRMVIKASDFNYQVEPDRYTNDADKMEKGESSKDDSGEGGKRLELPLQGFISSKETRFVSPSCIICLCDYEVGDGVVWSSNDACEHAFHAECIERWLLKQRGRPLCPCCRRDFVIDPLDEEEELNGAPVVSDDDPTTDDDDFDPPARFA